ncbi:MAG: hypothetical protein QOE90_330 [Thermoplasmata archaeon]|jgi:hypothetical protein|nr:hypothetical protein [Thermoplasmata archaeon]
MGTFRLGLALVLTLALAAPLASAIPLYPGNPPFVVGGPLGRLLSQDPVGHIAKVNAPCAQDAQACLINELLEYCVYHPDAPVCVQTAEEVAWMIVCLTPDQGVGLNLEGPGSGCMPLTSYVPPPPSGLPP